MARRPIRDGLELATDTLPRGPFGFAGQGNLAGAIGLAGVQIASLAVPGSELDPGFTVVSSTREMVDGKQNMTFTINAYSRDVARFVAKKRSAPSNLDLFLRDVNVTSVEEQESRSTASTWKVTTVLDEREVTEKLEGDEENAE